MHNRENVILLSATISAMFGVFRSLKYEHDVSSPASLRQAVQKLSPYRLLGLCILSRKIGPDRPFWISTTG